MIVVESRSSFRKSCSRLIVELLEELSLLLELLVLLLPLLLELSLSLLADCDCESEAPPGPPGHLEAVPLARPVRPPRHGRL